MSPDPTTPTTTPAAAPVETPQEPTAVAPEAVEPLGDAGKAALDSERKARREADKLAKDLAAKLQAIEDRDKSETQKLAEENARLKSEWQAATAKALRSEVAQAKGVPAALLTGTTQEEMEASADALLVFKGATPKLPTAPPAAGQGNVGTPVSAGGVDLDARIAAAQEAGDISLAISLINQKLIPRKD